MATIRGVDDNGLLSLAQQWGVNPGRVNEIEQLADQWEQLSGYQYKIDDATLGNFAQRTIAGANGGQSAINTLYDFGQNLAGHFGGAVAPWAQVGLRAQDYEARVSSFQSVYKDLIGRNASQDEINKAFAIGGGETSASDLRANIMQDTNMQQTYGWLTYGMNFQQFQQHKADLRTQFGGEVSDDQAVLQLKYDHALGHVLGAYQTAQLEPTGADQQQATERANPAIGPLQSSTR